MTDASKPPRPWVVDERYDDLEFHVRARPINEACIGFEVFNLTVHDDGNGPPLKFEKSKGRGIEPTPNIDEAIVLLKGSIKFDGCSDINFDNGGYLHSCSRQELTRFGPLFNKLFDIAMRLMPNNGEFLT